MGSSTPQLPVTVNSLYPNKNINFNFYRKNTPIDSTDLGSTEANLGRIVLSPVQFKILKLPEFLVIISYNNGDRQRITIDYNDKLIQVSGEADHLFDGDKITKDDVIEWGNSYASYAGLSKLFITANGEPLIRTESLTEFEFISDDFVETLEEVKLDSLIGEKNLGNYCIWSNGKLYGISQYNFTKLFYRRFLLWFSVLLFDGITESQNPDATKVTLTGIKIYFGKYLQTLGFKGEFKSTIPAELLPYVDTNIIDTSNLSQILPLKLISDFSAKISPDRKKSIVSSTSGYPEGTIVYLDIPPTPHFCRVSWLCFINNIEQFGMGCEIILAPGEVIINSINDIVFRAGQFEHIFYRGPNFPDAKRSKTIELVGSSDESAFVIRDAREFFIKEFKGTRFEYKKTLSISD